MSDFDQNNVGSADLNDDDADLQELQRQVESLQEDMKLKNLQETAAREEGTRKSTDANAAGSSGGKSGNTSVFVGGLDPSTTEADLRVFFNSCGTITRVTILKDHRSGQPKGTAYVEFESEEQAQGAMLKNTQSLHGKPLKVAPKRENVPAFQRGGAAGGRGFMPRGRGNAAMQQQMAAMAMMATMMSGGAFNPYGGAPRGRGRGRGGRGGY